MRRAFTPPLVFVFGLASITACKSKPGAEGAACTKKEDCIAELSCLDGLCTRLESEPEPTGHCATLTALAGGWTFDTTVIGAEDLSSRGINGHFQMEVSVDNCAGKIQLRKVGYDDVVYSEKKVQTSEAALSESQQIPGAVEATVSLKGKPTHTMTFLVNDGQLFGYYHYTETEWERAGIWGYLRGVKQGQDLADVEEFEVQPCEVRCLTQCDAARREADKSLDEPALAACMTACASDEPIVGCGPGKPLSEDLILGVNGPAKTLDELCGKATAAVLASSGLSRGGGDVRCEKEPKIKGKPTARKLGKARLNGSFSSAQLLQVGYFDAGYVGHLILALETEAGWYWTESLADLSMSGVGGMTVETKSMTLRPRDLVSAGGREVVVEVTVETADSDLGVNEIALDKNQIVAVCSAGSPPVCMRLTLDWSSARTLIDPKGDNPKKHPNLRSEQGELYVAFLPGDLVSISTPADARSADRELAAIYAWPQ